MATLARSTARRPVVVAVPTGVEAERIAADLREYLGDDAVELFPAWETLPFERVSPATETMGRRLRVIWRLRSGGEHLPRAIVAPVRALVQRLGPHVEDVEPVVVRAGARIDRDELLARLVTIGYRREYQVEARGEVAVRGSIVDVYPSTADHPVRIDLWGDEVDRLSHFSVADQRSSAEITESWIFPVRELLPTDEVRARARELLRTQPWGREQWERLAEGNTFDGMESWLPWLSSDEHLLLDLLPASALVAIIEPRRLRDRAQELLDEEAALAQALASTWGKPVDDADTPRLSLPFDRLLEHTKAQPVPVLSVPDSPDTPVLAASAFDPVVGDADALGEATQHAQTRRLQGVHRGRRQRQRGPDRADPRRRGRHRRPHHRHPRQRRRPAGARIHMVVAPARPRCGAPDAAARDRRRSRPDRGGAASTAARAAPARDSTTTKG